MVVVAVVTVALIGERSVEGLEAWLKWLEQGDRHGEASRGGKIVWQGGMTMGVPLS